MSNIFHKIVNITYDNLSEFIDSLYIEDGTRLDGGVVFCYLTSAFLLYTLYNRIKIENHRN